jgi:hypothetical protein
MSPVRRRVQPISRLRGIVTSLINTPLKLKRGVRANDKRNRFNGLQRSSKPFPFSVADLTPS